ncbi:unnamed protein product, partial [Anisakis simplex]|uniref:Protein amnionless n=1 Tax=Anisakis simplex TaxID=6269 RepID=A0A0M3J9Y7_ANISI
PNTAIGQKANWQCDKRATPQDASFITKPAASFFNGSNWMASVEGKETGFFLNALQVPSAEDTAVIQASGSNRMLIDDFIELDAFYFSNEVSELNLHVAT